MKSRVKPGLMWLGAVVGACALVTTSGPAALAAQQSLPAGHHTLVPFNKLPKNAVPYYGALPKTGARGLAFTPKASIDSSLRIVGGSPALSSDFPYVVGIESFFSTEDSSGNIQNFVATCTGTIISSTKVLTAGHCATELPGPTFVIAGSSNLNDTTSGFVAGVQSTWTDQNFNLAALNNPNGTVDTPTDDVAVLTLQAPLPSVYTPVSLTAQGDQTPYAEGTSATIVGYGETTPGDPTTVGVLESATVQIQSDTTCGTAMSPANGYNPGYESATMTCAGVPPTFGVDSCNGDSGGPLLVGGVEAGITDWGNPNCGAVGTYGVYERLSAYNSLITGSLSNPPLVNLDFLGGGHAGLMGLNSSGQLVYYAGSGFLGDDFNGFCCSGVVGTGFGGFRKVFRVTNWNDDGTESVMAVAQNGNLYQWTTDGEGDFTNNGAAQLIGTGWNTFSDIMVVNNWNGDGNADLLGRTSTGNLYFYETNGQGGWENGGIGQLIGTGWNVFNTVLTPGDWKGDGHQALIGRTSTGTLDLYESAESPGTGGWENGGIGQQIGTGWNIFSTFMSPGDWNGDGLIDMIGITPLGVMDLYESDGQGNWLNGGRGIQIGTGWNIFKAVF